MNVPVTLPSLGEAIEGAKICQWLGATDGLCKESLYLPGFQPDFPHLGPASY